MPFTNEKSTRLRWLYEAAERTLVLAREGLHPRRFGVRHRERIGPALTSPVMVSVEHDPRRRLAILVEYLFKHIRRQKKMLRRCAFLAPLGSACAGAAERMLEICDKARISVDPAFGVSDTAG